MPGYPTVSFELFPPRRPELDEIVWQRVLRMAAAGPDFFSVTYGASGSSRAASANLVRRLLVETRIPPIAHLTCVGSTREELADRVRTLLDSGVRDFLALRGDPPAGETEWRPVPGGLSRSSELVALIRQVETEHLGLPAADRAPGTGDEGPVVGIVGGPDGAREPTPEPSVVARELGVERADVVSVAVAAYPAGASHGREAELEALREKQDAGADFAITQVFFDPEAYGSLVAEARAVGIRIPILPGIIPMTDRGRLHRLSELTGVPVPATMDALLAIDDEHERLRRGIDATLALIDRVLAAGAPGLHLYTFNHDRPALDVLEHLRARGLRNPAVVGGADSTGDGRAGAG